MMPKMGGAPQLTGIVTLAIPPDSTITGIGAGVEHCAGSPLSVRVACPAGIPENWNPPLPSVLMLCAPGFTATVTPARGPRVVDVTMPWIEPGGGIVGSSR